MAKREVRIIKPVSGWIGFDWSELWLYRELFVVFVWRDIKVRYKQTLLGVGWAIFQPALSMIIFTIFFGNLASMPSDGVPYPVFVFSGLLFWNYFSASLTNSADSMVVNENLIKKTYFPRELLLLSTVSTPVVDYFFGFLFFLGLSFFWRTGFGWGILLLPVLLVLVVFTSLGAGMFLASINVKYRDVRYLLPFFIQLLLFVTPVIYPVSIVPKDWRLLTYVNPVGGVIDTARVLLFGGSINYLGLSVSVLVAGLMFVMGYAYFRRTERFFADLA